MTTEKKIPTNFVHLYGYVKKLFLNEKVGTINISVEEEYKGKKTETFLNVLCFGKALECAKVLKEGQYLTVQGRQSRKEHEGQWKQETIANLVTPSDKFAHVSPKKEEYEKEFKTAFEIPF